MSTQTIIAPHRFAFGYYRQTSWNWLIGTAFFLGGVGGGTFIISFLTHHGLGMLIGYLIVMVGKNTAHLKFLGRPERFWRAAMRPDRSWIARGIWATGLLGIGGLFCWLPYFSSVAIPSWILAVAPYLAVPSALFIMFYDGFVMNHSAAVPFWNSRLLPALILMYAALGGTTVSLTIRELQGLEGPTTTFLAQAEHLLLIINFGLLAFYLLRMAAHPYASETVRELLHGRYAKAFFGLVLAIGIGATLVLSLVHDRAPAAWLVVLIALCELVGDFSLLMLILKSGLFAPQTAREYQRAA